MSTETLELSTTGILSLFETSKSERKSFVQDVINRLDSGEIEPLKVHLQLKAMEDVITQFTDKKKYPETARLWCDAILTGKSFYSLFLPKGRWLLMRKAVKRGKFTRLQKVHLRL
jgi:hypothetical protein